MAAKICAVGILLLSACAHSEPGVGGNSPENGGAWDRSIGKQPSYVVQPRYALIVVGGDRKFRIWLALDKSKADSPYYDVLHFDRDGDGNLGEEGEMVRAVPMVEGRVKIQAGRVANGLSGVALEELEITTYGTGGAAFYVNFRLRSGPNTVDLYGGFGPGMMELRPGRTPDQAPILYADPWGPLSFQCSSYDFLWMGRENDFRLMVGTAGPGPVLYVLDGLDPYKGEGAQVLRFGTGTFMAVDEHFLDLEKDEIWVTLIARDRAGAPVQERVRFREHC